MCDICGCTQEDGNVSIKTPAENQLDDGNNGPINNKTHTHNQLWEHDHNHDHTHFHDHHEHDHHEHDHHQSHDHPVPHMGNRIIQIESDILQKNNLIAERNRGYFEAKNILALNMVSSPGSGKTSLLEKTLSKLKSEIDFYVIEGDQRSMNDANRIDRIGVPVVQVNTGNGCHLDSEMVNKAFKKIDVQNNSVLIIENVGNLVCPSLFDLGESKRVILISVTEGDDKPVKYPNMFHSSDLCIINKIDLLPYVDFDISKAKEYALKVNHHLEFIELSVKSEAGLESWFNWIKNRMIK